MHDTIYLIVTKRGIDRHVKTRPKTLRASERCIPLTVKVPDRVFEPHPIPGIEIEITEESVFGPETTGAIRHDPRDCPHPGPMLEITGPGEIDKAAWALECVRCDSSWWIPDEVHDLPTGLGIAWEKRDGRSVPVIVDDREPDDAPVEVTAEARI